MALLRKNARVYLACRDLAKGAAANEDILAETGRQAVLLGLDLSDISSVQKAATGFLR